MTELRFLDREHSDGVKETVGVAFVCDWVHLSGVLTPFPVLGVVIAFGHDNYWLRVNLSFLVVEVMFGIVRSR